jgi:hypothetical protein
MTEDNLITISKKEYLRLRKAEEELTRLENGGVDNWEWYGESLNPKGDIDLEEWEIREKKRIEPI